METSRALLVHFLDVMTGDMYRKKLSVVVLDVKYYLQWVIEVGVSAVRGI